MNGQCSICCTIFQSFDGLCSTLCGHVFHFSCLSQCLKRSQMCPQCQTETDRSQVVRLSFHNSNNSSQSEDLAMLQKKLDDLELKIKSKDIDLNHYRNYSRLLENQVSTLKSQMRRIESDTDTDNTDDEISREEMSYIKTKLKFVEEKILSRMNRNRNLDFTSMENNVAPCANDRQEN